MHGIKEGKMKDSQRQPFRRCPNFVVVENNPDGPYVIRDIGPWDQHPTVTNGAEHVVRQLVAQGMLANGRRFFYHDSSGDLDEILVVDGKFAGFRVLGFEQGSKHV
jgi:hypothetical protein